MPIGVIRPTTMVAKLMMSRWRSPTRLTRRAEIGVQPLPLAPGGVARRPVALVELPRDPIEPRDRPFDLVGDFGHFALNRRERRGRALELGLVHAFGARDIALRLLDFLAERVDRLLHVAERLELELVDLVHRVVDVLERALQRLQRNGRADAACSWIAPVCVRSISPVESIMPAVVVLSAPICSSTSFWLVIAWATVTAVRSAATVVVEARSTPFTSSTLFFLTRSSAR